MKKLKLLLTAFALLGGVISVNAQTDVTSTYITNPGFEGDYQRFLDINNDRGVEKPVGWSVEWYQNNNDKNGMTYVAENFTQDDKTWSAKSGKAYFARMRWNVATLYLRQTLQNLRPGSYTLSFSAAAYSAAAGATVQVSVAGQTQTILSGAGGNADGNWTDYNISFTVTASTPYATIEYMATRGSDNLKIGLDEFSLTYDGSSYYNTILTAAQALYDDNEDWAENGLSDFADAITANSGKETVADKNAAIVALEEAMATFKTANSVDMTAKITNPNFDSDISGWTTTGGDGNAFQRQTSEQLNFTGGFLEKWRNGWNGAYNQKNFDVSQTLSSLPNGEYTLKAYIIAQMQGSKETLGDNYMNKKHGGPYYIDDDKGVWFYATSGSNSANTWANSFTPTFGDTGGGVLRSATVNVENGSLTIGFKGIGSESGGTSLGTYANWIACDNWKLSYFGFDPTALKAEITSLKEAAAALLENAEYNNVTGSERTNLSGVASLIPANEKKATLEALISTIESRISAFTSAKSSYDAYAEANGIATTLEATSVTAPTTAAEAINRAKELYVNIDTKVNSDYTFDATAIYGGDFTDFTDTNTGQHWSDNASKAYIDGWGNTTVTATQNITLPAGKYVLKAVGRAGSNTNAYMSANGTTVNFAKNGDTGKGVDTSGAVNYGSGTFANDGNGRGWEWRFIPVTLASETTITVNMTLERSWDWGSFCDFTILMSADDLADSDDYTSLNAAISTAEAKTLGFEDTQYAPYNNVEALKKLAEAKAINTSADNPKIVVTTATADLTGATWTANVGFMQPIYNGLFATVAEGQNYPDGWKRTNGWGQMQSGISGYYSTAYYNQPGSLQYGNQGVYTMPLAANTAYALTFAYRSHENNSNNKMTISVLNAADGLPAMNFAGNGSTSEWKVVTKNFKTGAAGNYILTLANDGNTWITNVSLVKAGSGNETIEISTAGFATYVSDVDLDFSSASSIEAYKVKVESQAVAKLTKVEEVPAGTPVLLYADGGATEDIPVMSGAAAVSDNDLVAGTGATVATTDGEYTNMILNNVDDNIGFYFAAGKTVAKNRAYLHIANSLAPAAASRMVMVFADEATGISTVKDAGSKVDGYYDLQGRRVTQPAKGLYIVNGKKVVIK